MSIDTDASELSRQARHQNERLHRDYERSFYSPAHKGNISSGPGTWLSNLLLAIIAGLLAVAVPGQIYINYTVRGDIAEIKAIQKLMLDGRIGPGAYKHD